uniref:C2H2-type domain-containing protein n=1 Tax=Romanomermis culicivorax TaxID=13658 RepID=A0A915JFV8_ROMCU
MRRMEYIEPHSSENNIENPLKMLVEACDRLCKDSKFDEKIPLMNKNLLCKNNIPTISTTTMATTMEKCPSWILPSPPVNVPQIYPALMIDPYLIMHFIWLQRNIELGRTLQMLRQPMHFCNWHRSMGEFCGKVFHSIEELAAHIRQSHMKEPNVYAYGSRNAMHSFNHYKASKLSFQLIQEKLENDEDRELWKIYETDMVYHGLGESADTDSNAMRFMQNIQDFHTLLIFDLLRHLNLKDELFNVEGSLNCLINSTNFDLGKQSSKKDRRHRRLHSSGRQKPPSEKACGMKSHNEECPPQI